MQEIQKEKSTTERRLSEMTERVRVILRNRSKEKAQEWRQMAKEINVKSHLLEDFVALTPRCYIRKG